MTSDTPITNVLATPLSPDWTVEGLAEQVLSAIAVQRPEEGHEFVLDADATTDRQSRRILRPLLACLATKSAAEAGTPVNLYGGRLSFKRQGPEGPVWILGEFQNTAAMARAVFRRSTSPLQNSALKATQSPVLTGAASLPHASQTPASSPADDCPTRPAPEQSTLADRRRRAKEWAASYAKYAKNVLAGASPHTVPPLGETMCYEIGKIYRDDWSHADAEKLAANLGLGIGGFATGLAPVIGPIIFPLFGAISGGLFGSTEITEQKLMSASESIIKHFESPIESSTPS